MTVWRGPLEHQNFVAIIVGDADTHAVDAVAVAGGRVRDEISWAAAGPALASQVDSPVVMVETAGADDATLAEGLPRIAAVLKQHDLYAVVALAPAQIDRVTAVMLCQRVQLLCEPTLAERVTALTIAHQLGHGMIVHDRVSEGEDARLARLNAEVSRIAEVLARLSRREDTALHRADIAARPVTYQPEASGERVAEPIDGAAVRQTIRARRLRTKQFGDGLFEDPAWDILLDLYAAHLERAQVSVSSLCIAAAVAPTTALRWIAKMTDADLLVREADPFDKRRAFMALSPRALDGMRGYVALLQSLGLPLV